MTAVAPVPRSTSTPWSGRAAVVLAAGGAAALLARPWLAAAVADPTAALVVLFVGLGAVGAWCPLPGPAAARAGPAATATTAVVTLVGVGAFAAGRLLAGGRPAAPALAAYLVLNTLAAVAEEAFFRRFVYGLLEPAGQVVAIVGSAAAFAAVHLTVWGAWAVPLDLAAGLVLAWQRAATGRWSVPAITHAAANVLAVL
ncbi:MAG TPA: CPBP family intramembrane glutamic endopeptidase [Acidimicrobiales bacterium]|nr:CPBP family intramembrane glutamic endopeptidase [Acidimicrobiales bacterium]